MWMELKTNMKTTENEINYRLRSDVSDLFKNVCSVLLSKNKTANIRQVLILFKVLIFQNSASVLTPNNLVALFENPPLLSSQGY